MASNQISRIIKLAQLEQKQKRRNINMIRLTDMRGNVKLMDAARILEIKKVPETLLVFIDGNRVMVKESIDDIIRLMAIKKHMLSGNCGRMHI